MWINHESHSNILKKTMEILEFQWERGHHSEINKWNTAYFSNHNITSRISLHSTLTTFMWKKKIQYKWKMLWGVLQEAILQCSNVLRLRSESLKNTSEGFHF